MITDKIDIIKQTRTDGHGTILIKGIPDSEREVELLNLKLQMVTGLMEQREEILKAFIAKYGIEPDDVEQVFEHEGDKIIWRVRRKGDQ